MYAANSILAARGGCSALSNGCRGVTSRSSSSHASNRRNNNSGVLAAASSAGAACAMCHSVRMTAACSASTTALHLRHAHTAASSSQDIGAARRSIPSSNVHGGHQTHFGNGMDSSAMSWNVARDRLKSSNGTLGNNYSALNIRTVSSSSQVNKSLLLKNDAFGGLMGSYVGGMTAAAVSSQDALLDGSAAAGGAASSGWKLQELAGAILFAGVATAGSMLLGPIEGLGGKSGSGGGGGGGDPGGGGGGGPPVSGKYENAFDSPAKEKENQEPQLAVGIASLPKPYEVSVRALRGGRLSMEDEFVVVSGGRLSAVFDGHGGGGVSQYLRDRLHVIITEQLDHQEKLLKSNRKFIPRMFGMGKKTAQAQADASTEDAESKPKRYDLSNIGNLPVTAVAAALKESFDQVDKEILLNDEYEYQGSTAVATLLHESSDGTRTLLSANIGDSRGVLSRNGRAIDLTRDHKPNDDKEKARILAMGEKIEWDHYCKVHRVRNLSLSRAIGDRFAKPAVSGEVEIKRFPVYDDKDEFILLASDGLWDVMSSQEVVSYVHKRLNAPPKDGADITCEEDMACLKYLRRKNMSRFVANEALRRGSGDNISVVMIYLNEIRPPLM